MTIETAKILITVEELAVRWSLTKQSIYNATGPGTARPFPIRPVRFGPRTIRFRLADVLAVKRGGLSSATRLGQTLAAVFWLRCLDRPQPMEDVDMLLDAGKSPGVLGENRRPG